MTVTVQSGEPLGIFADAGGSGHSESTDRDRCESRPLDRPRRNDGRSEYAVPCGETA